MTHSHTLSPDTGSGTGDARWWLVWLQTVRLASGQRLVCFSCTDKAMDGISSRCPFPASLFPHLHPPLIPPQSGRDMFLLIADPAALLPSPPPHSQSLCRAQQLGSLSFPAGHTAHPYPFHLRVWWSSIHCIHTHGQYSNVCRVWATLVIVHARA